MNAKARTKTHRRGGQWATARAYLLLLAQETGTAWEAEHRFHPVRRWRFDYAAPELRVALEVDGGVWQYGRHNRAAGYLRDMEKMNAAAAAGWLVLHTTPDRQWSKATLDTVAQACTARAKRKDTDDDRRQDRG